MFHDVLLVKIILKAGILIMEILHYISMSFELYVSKASNTVPIGQRIYSISHNVLLLLISSPAQLKDLHCPSPCPAH